MNCLTTIVGKYIEKKESDSILKKEKEWKEIDSFKVSDNSLKELDNSVIHNLSMNVYHKSEHDSKEKIEVRIVEKSDDILSNDIKGCYIKQFNESFFVKNRFELLVQNHKNMLKNDYIHLKICLLKKEPIIYGALTLISLSGLYFFRDTLNVTSFLKKLIK